MLRMKLLLAVTAAGLLSTGTHGSDPAVIADLISKLNEHETVKAQESGKSYTLLFDAYLELSAPPQPIGEDFNLKTIHAKMPNWSSVSGWAESNPGLAVAINEARTRVIIGLPYGRDNVSATYQEAGLMVDIGIGGDLRNYRFPYLDAVDTISAYATAESYRLMEAGQVEAGLKLAISHLMVLRQACDRDFRYEKLHSMELLSIGLSNMRDLLYVYGEKIASDRLMDIAKREVPFLRPDRNRLFLPEADKLISEALIREVFDESTGSPRLEEFARSFARVQSADEPLTRFGAARRWQMIATVHGSLDASLSHLEQIYDDWWRRWRVQEYDTFVTFATHEDRINPVRYAAVIYSTQDMESLVPTRNRLITEVNGTALAAGFSAYKRVLGETPSDMVKVRPQYVRKLTDTDPFHPDYDHFRYRVVSTPGRAATEGEAIDTPEGRVWVADGEPLLYSVGQDMTDDRARDHRDDGHEGDIVIWPPVKTLQREAGIIE